MDQKPKNATTIFVLGLLGILLCQILGIIAWVQGNTYLATCRRLRVQPEGTAVAGRILGIISTILLIISVVVVSSLVGIGLAGALSSN